ncbi:MAG: hypothetical protein ACK4TA_14240 [Saprospiraceae bacterium]
MKKAFLALTIAVLSVVSTFATNSMSIERDVTLPVVSSQSCQTLDLFKYYDAKTIHSLQKEGAENFFEKCKLTVKGTVDGKSINVTLEFEADNCFKAYAEILKNLK